MNYYNKIKNELINNEINKRVKDYSKNRSDLQTYYSIGKLLSEAGKHYGEGIIKEYSKRLSNELGKGYGISSLKNMRQFYVFFLKNQTMPGQLTWSHYIELLKLNDLNSINYYINICAKQNLSVRQLRQRIKNNEYERLSHGDYDHMGEAINLVNNFKVEKVIFNCGPYNDLEKELIKVLDKKKIKYYSCIKELNIDKNNLYFLQTKEYDNENDNSNVIYTELNNYKFLFMGDAGITTEKEIMNKYNFPDIDVLKVGHHGSKTSSGKDFINEINPKYSIISVGKNNRYGHPNKEVLDNLRDSKIYRTDQDGSIMFKIKNNQLKIETCSP